MHSLHHTDINGCALEACWSLFSLIFAFKTEALELHPNSSANHYADLELSSLIQNIHRQHVVQNQTMHQFIMVDDMLTIVNLTTVIHHFEGVMNPTSFCRSRFMKTVNVFMASS